MDPTLKHDREHLAALLEKVCGFSAETLAGIGERPVVPGGEPELPTGLPSEGLGGEPTLDLFVQSIAPHLAAGAGPRHLGFVTGGSTPAAVAGDWLTAVFDQNAMSHLDAHAALELERQTLGMLRELFGLPPEFHGSFVSGATMSNFVGLALAREWVGRRHGVWVSEEGLAAVPPFEVLAATPHSSALKCLSMLGIGRRQWSQVACLPGREAMEVAALERQLTTAALPGIVLASAGTLNTADFDDLGALANLKARDSFWLHVDAAFGGFASVSPELAQLVNGWEQANSICIDLHKWLNVPYDAAVVFTRHRDLQFDVFKNDSPYLAASAEAPEPIHLVPENSHRWRALAAWFSLMAYGRAGYREIVERDCRLAGELGRRMEESKLFRLLAPVKLNIVCFDCGAAEKTQPFLAAVRQEGTTFLTATVHQGASAVRAAFSNWSTEEADLERIWQALVAAAEGLGR